MKWILLKSVYGDHAAGTKAQFDDAEATVLIKSKIGEATEAPAEVNDAAAAAADALVERLSNDLFTKAIEHVTQKSKSGKGGRPNYGDIKVNPDNELADPTDGFRSLSEFSGHVRKACTGQGLDKRLELKLKANGASENVAADGGYAVPVQYATNIYNDIQTQDSLMSECFMVPMSSNSMKFPSVNYTQEGVLGVTAYWENEGGSIATSKPKYRQPALTLNKLAALVPVTTELLEDGVAVESLISFLAAEALTFKLNESILFGTGAGQPVGIVGHASTATVTRATANTVKAQDVINMNAAFNGKDSNGQWLINKGTVEPQLLTIQDAGGRYLYFAPGSFAGEPAKGRLLGKQVRPVMNCAALGSSGDIILADLKGYLLGYKTTGVEKAMSIHLFFQTSEVAYRFQIRVDGRPWRDTVLNAAKGSGTYSNAVTM